MLTCEQLPEGGIVLRCEGRDIVDPATLLSLCNAGATVSDEVLADLHAHGASLSGMGSILERSIPEFATAALWADVAPMLAPTRHLELLEQLALAKHERLRKNALTQLVAHGDADVLARALATFERTAAERGLSHVAVLEMRRHSGDTRALQELVRVGFADMRQRDEAVEALTRHPPLRRALGFDDAEANMGWVTEDNKATVLWLFDDLMALRAAEEWLVEQQEGARSRWRNNPEFAWSSPAADAKRQGFEWLLEMHKYYGVGESRVLPRDFEVDPTAPPPNMTICFGWMHGGGLIITAYRSAGAKVDAHRFFATTNDEDGKPKQQLIYQRGALQPARYKTFAVQLRTLRSARILQWWNGPEAWRATSTGSFAAGIHGLASDRSQPSWFYGSPSGDEIQTYLPLFAAGMLDQQLAEDAQFQSVALDTKGRTVFVEAWRHHRDRWLRPDCWWFQREILAMATGIADARLIPELQKFVSEDSTKRFGDRVDDACDALAACTGEDMRFDASGARRNRADVARDYRKLLQDRSREQK